MSYVYAMLWLASLIVKAFLNCVRGLVFLWWEWGCVLYLSRRHAVMHAPDRWSGYYKPLYNRATRQLTRYFVRAHTLLSFSFLLLSTTLYLTLHISFENFLRNIFWRGFCKVDGGLTIYHFFAFNSGFVNYGLHFYGFVYFGKRFWRSRNCDGVWKMWWWFVYHKV